jgi:predicted nucleic acid-binding Zn ribbon protein
LRYLGVLILAGAAWLVLAESFGWLPISLTEIWLVPTIYAGGICLVSGLLLGMLSPVGRHLSKTRCVRCGAPIEKGQTYCLDHLRETLNEYRDRQRKSALDPPAPGN